MSDDNNVSDAGGRGRGRGARLLQVSVFLTSAEGKALAVMARRFTFDDALRFLHRVANVKADDMVTAMTKLRAALDAARNQPNNR